MVPIHAPTLDALRRRRDMSVRDLAARSGLGKSLVHALCVGVIRSTGASNVDALATTLDVSADLFSGRDVVGLVQK